MPQTKEANLDKSRQKFVELEQKVEQSRRESKLLARPRSFGDVISLAFKKPYQLARNVSGVIRVHGGIYSASRYFVSYMQGAGLTGTFRAISQRLNKPETVEPATSSATQPSTFDRRTPFQFKSSEQYEALYKAHLKSRKSSRTIAVFRAITGGYDQPLNYEHYLDDADYFTFSDEPLAVKGLNLPAPKYDVSPIRRARYVKMHPHFLFSDHEIAVWHDGNVMIREDITPFIDAVLSSNKPIGAFLHPKRDNIYDEGWACIEAGKGDPHQVLEQLKRYSEEGYFSQRLVESNFLVYNLKHPELRPILTKWWAELDRGSHRDQLSFNVAVDSANADFFALADRPICVRNHSSFAFFPNHGLQNNQGANKLRGGLAPSEFDRYRPADKHNENPTTDVLVCVHNALEDVQKCLASVVKNRGNTVRKLIIIDDGSDEQTRQWLSDFASNNENTLLARSEVARGYTKAANHGISLSSAEHLVLLNSDAVIGAGAIDKMLTCLTRLEGAGIVGPLSNAASSQSIPDSRNTPGQTAINMLPQGYGVDDMDRWCEQNAHDLTFPDVPFVHGFCMGVTREVFEKIGGFDEAKFPNGYGEENDFCIRASEHGFRLVIALNAFVYHAKSKSYSDDSRRRALMRAGNEKLTDLYGADRIGRLVRSMEQNPTLAKMRERSLDLYK